MHDLLSHNWLICTWDWHPTDYEVYCHIIPVMKVIKRLICIYMLRHNCIEKISEK